MAISTARPSSARSRVALDDRELAKLAIAGDGDAFARLYDRHERRVYGFCLRMLGTSNEAGDATQETFMRLLRRLPALEGREVNFVAYALTTARNACYDTIAARRRTEPVGEGIDRAVDGPASLAGRHPGEPGDVAGDPERAALLAASREDVRAANARLPERQREVLALRELEQLSYEQIGEIVGCNENAVAQLISRARIRLRDLIRGDALESITASSPDCERALPLLVRRQDDQRSGAEELDWLRMHVADCDTCRLSCAAMEEAGVSYRALGPIVPLAWLRHTTIARAARFVGADWSHLTAAGVTHGTTPAITPPSSTPPAAIDSHIAAAGHEGVSGRTRAATRRIRPLSVVSARGPMGRRLRWTLLGAILCGILVVVLVGSLAPDNRALPHSQTSALSSTTTGQAGGHLRAHAIGHAHRASAPVSASLDGNHGAALAAIAHGGSGQPSIPKLAVHRARRVTHHRSTHRSHSTPATPAGGTQSPQPPATTPTSTTSTPSPPSGGSGGSTTGGGSGSGTPAGGGETPGAPAETPGGSSGSGSGSSGGSPGGSSEGGHGCALAIACP